MNDFFRGWRRKTGCVMLCLAMALLTLWLRSRLVGDQFDVAICGYQHHVVLLDGAVFWWSLHEGQTVTAWRTEPVFDSKWQITEVDMRYYLQKKFNGAVGFAINIWGPVLLLTAASVWLILFPALSTGQISPR